MQEYEKLFYKIIDKLNKKGDYCTHYYDVGNNQIMEVSFHNSWSFKIIKLEVLNGC